VPIKESSSNPKSPKTQQRDCVEKGQIILKYVFTKALPLPKFKYFIEKLNVEVSSCIDIHFTIILMGAI